MGGLTILVLEMGFITRVLEFSKIGRGNTA
jgi:hypothetical protein